jgi:Cu(I)/Ag(I) efflux system membrane protein CusA/SilA
MAAALLLAVTGELARRTLGRDAIPDLSNPQIVLAADWMGHPATEVSERVTHVMTRALEGVPGSTAIRGLSMAGTAYVDVIFESLADLEPGRQAILDRVSKERESLPATVRLQVGPLASSTGWVFEYVLVDPRRQQSAVVLRQLQEDVLRPALASIPGVVEVASVGAGVQQILVELEASRLRARGVAVTDVVTAVDTALVSHTQDLELLRLPVPSPTGELPRIEDIGRVRVTDDTPLGIADFRGIQPAVGRIVVAGRDADLPTLIAAVKRTLNEQRPRLPVGVELVTAYDRSDLIARVWRTLFRALAEEVGVVVLVTLTFLLHGRSALVTLLTLPVVLLLAFGGMRLAGIPATIMSLGGIGIALGMAVDADVVALEACHRRLEGLTAYGADRRAQLLAAAGSVAPAILTSLVIAALTFLPVFAFSGESGRLLRPLVLAKTLVIGAAAVVTLTLAPALRERLLRGPVTPELANPLTRALVRTYRPFVHFALTRPWLTLTTAAFAVLSCLPILSRLGGEFLPHFNEGDLLFMPTTLPGASAADLSATQLFQQDRALRGFPEVSAVFGKVGRADTATDPAPYSMAETVIRLAPRSEWPTVARTRWYSGWAPRSLRRVLGLIWPEATRETEAELVAKLDRATRLPGWINAWTAPARARMDMMATGVRTPVGIRVVAANPVRLDALGSALCGVVTRVPWTRSAAFESLGGEPWLEFEPDAAALALHSVDPHAARSMADLLVTGGQIGQLERDGRPMRVRIAPDVNMAAMTPDTEPLRGLADQLRAATVRASGGGPPVPLALVGRVGYVTKPAMLRTERGELVGYIYVDLTEGADLSSYIERARREVDAAIAGGQVRLEPGERIEWTGQYELLTAGQRRLRWIVPIVAISMLLLLFLQFRSLTEALIVLISVPFALVGSFWTLFLLGYSLSAPVWVGLLSAVGLAMQTGVVMVVYIDAAFHGRLREGLIRTRDDIVAAHAEGTIRRLRPKVMTITTMAASLLPLLWAEGPGADIMKRVAAPMIGGLASTAFLTLEVLPVLYTLWRNRQLRCAHRSGLPLASIVGEPPFWADR